VVDPAATPDLVPKGAMVLQPSEERRRSGSHYTPRERERSRFVQGDGLAAAFEVM